MAQLNALQSMLVEKKIRDIDLLRIYGARMHFPVTFRDKYAVWIESQDWDDYIKNENHTDIGRHKFDELVQLMHGEMNTMQPLLRIDFKNSMDDFVDHYENDYDAFLNMMSTILRTERMLIQSSQEDMGEDRHVNIAKENTAITESVNILGSKLRTMERQLKQLEEIQEESLLSLNELTGKKSKLGKQKNPPAEELQKIDKEYGEILQNLCFKRQAAAVVMHEVCFDMQNLLTLSWNELDQWKEDQRIACTMLRKPKENIIEVLDRMFESVSGIFVIALGQVDRFLILMKLLSFQNDQNLKQADADNQKMDLLLMAHLQRVFVVDKHIPKQVLKVTNGKSLGFSMSVRLLGGHALGLSANKPKVSVKLFPEKQIDEVINSQKEFDSCCKMQNSTDKSFQFINRGSCFASFDHMIVSGVKREGKGRNDDFVTDYKHAFVFYTTVRIQEKKINLKAQSLPLVITSQTSQECMARGTIIWGAAFPKPEEERSTPFEAMEEVEWKGFAEVMNAMFVEYTNRPLTPENIKFLAKKAFREANDLNFDLQSISIKAIFKDKLPCLEFPFWKWFMSCLNSVKDTLKSEWREGLIYGFISKSQADRILHNEPKGTFLIRFSESNIEQGQRADIHGILTVAVNELHPNNGQTMVFHIKESLSHKDLAEKKLAPILDAYEVQDWLQSFESKTTKKLLKTLWTPDQRHGFEDVFGKHIQEKENKNDGYRRGRYVIEIFLADQRPRRTSTQTQFTMSPPPPSPAQSDYSDIGDKITDLGMGTLNMDNMQMYPAQTSCAPPVLQVLPQVARVHPNQANHINRLLSNQNMIPTVVQDNASTPTFDLELFSQVVVDGATDPSSMLGPNGLSMLDYLNFAPEQQAIGVGAVPSMNGLHSSFVQTNDDGDVMLADSNLIVANSVAQSFQTG